jgi:hypothetical protein
LPSRIDGRPVLISNDAMRIVRFILEPFPVRTAVPRTRYYPRVSVSSAARRWMCKDTPGDTSSCRRHLQKFQLGDISPSSRSHKLTREIRA